MNSKAIKIMLALCVVLLVILIIEWQVTGIPVIELTDSDLTDQEFKNDEKKLSAIKITKPPITFYANMVDRPLFIQGRRNVESVVEKTINLEASKIEDLTLVGIFSNKDRLVAAFSKQGAEKKFVKISEDENIAGWLVTEVQSDKILLEKGAKQKTLFLRAPKEKVTQKSLARQKLLARKRKKPKS